MDFALTDQQQQIKDSIVKLCENFGPDYWLERDNEGGFPEDFYQAMAKDGWLGIAMPEEYGGAGLGITEAAIMLQAIAQSGAALSGASAIHINVFGPHPIVVHGTPEQKQRWLVPLIKGEEKACFGVTEPDAGLNTAAIKTRAVWDGGKYVVNGRKMWTTTAQEAKKILLLARTTPREECKRRMDGISLFYTDLNRDYVEIREIAKMGRKAVDTNALFIDNLPVPKEDLIGEEGRGFYYLLDGLNPERILIAAEAIGIGRAALDRAARYARERVVFDRPIGQNQGIQHPLADTWAKLAAVDALMFKAAWLYDTGQPCGAEANASKYLAGEFGFEACERAVLTHGGMGYAKEFHVERYMREIMIARIAPISRELVLSYLAERVLDLPKSY
ncbi:MAG: acyl-CoA dehydrogenase family protein [Alphaproteobacteria bacterium]